MESNEEIQNYINSLDENGFNLIYNTPTKKVTSHIIQFKQLIAYFNFKILLKEKLSNSNTKNESLKEMYLIDKEWFKKWKIHVGYKDIKHFYISYKMKKTILGINDYDWIEPVINNNSKIILSPLNNKKIYDNKNVLDLNSEFIIVNKECYSLFSLNFIKEQDKLNNVKNYEVRIYFGKLILIINELVYLLKFKGKKFNCNFELLIIFEKNKIDRNKFFKEISNCDINDWIKKQNFDLYSCEKKELSNLTIINKTILNKKRKSLDFGKKDKMNEGIMNATNQLSNNILAGNRQNVEKFLSQTRVDKYFQDEPSSKLFNSYKLFGKYDLCYQIN